jgi:hypothetical protein
MVFTDGLEALKKSGLIIPTLRIIPGPEEAYRGWVTGKYLHTLYSQMEPVPELKTDSFANSVEYLKSRQPWFGATVFANQRQYVYERNAMATPVFIEMGGSSVQIAYMVDKDEYDADEAGAKYNRDFIVQHDEFEDQSKPTGNQQKDTSKNTVMLYQRSFLYAGGEDVKKLYIRSTLQSEGSKKEDGEQRGRKDSSRFFKS